METSGTNEKVPESFGGNDQYDEVLYIDQVEPDSKLPSRIVLRRLDGSFVAYEPTLPSLHSGDCRDNVISSRATYLSSVKNTSSAHEGCFCPTRTDEGRPAMTSVMTTRDRANNNHSSCPQKPSTKAPTSSSARFLFPNDRWQRNPSTENSERKPSTRTTVTNTNLATPSPLSRISHLRPPLLLPPSGIHPDPSKKEFCTHWIRTGECDYTQQGCKFKHEIPEFRTLKQIGFNDYPAWYKAKQKITTRRMQVNPEGSSRLEMQLRRIDEEEQRNDGQRRQGMYGGREHVSDFDPPSSSSASVASIPSITESVRPVRTQRREVRDAHAINRIPAPAKPFRSVKRTSHLQTSNPIAPPPTIDSSSSSSSDTGPHLASSETESDLLILDITYPSLMPEGMIRATGEGCTHTRRTERGEGRKDRLEDDSEESTGEGRCPRRVGRRMEDGSDED